MGVKILNYSIFFTKNIQLESSYLRKKNYKALIFNIFLPAGKKVKIATKIA